MNTNLATIPSAPPSAVIDRTAMTRAIEIAAMVTEKRTTYPILANVRLTGDGGAMFVQATNVDMEITVAIPAAADTDFDLTLPAHLLKSLTKGAPKADHVAFTMPEIVTLKTYTTTTDPETGEEVKCNDTAFDDPVPVEFERARYDLNGLPPGAWPTLKGPGDKANRFTLPGAAFINALQGTAFAVSTEETRYYLNGVYLHHVPANGVARYNGSHGKLVFVATDGHRMAQQRIDAPEGAEGMPGVILPRNLVNLCLKLMGKDVPETVNVEADDSKVRVAFDDITITSKTIEGTFPDYERVTPRNNDKAVSVKIADMQEALKAVSLIASPRGGKAVKLTVEDDASLALTVDNHDNGSACTAIAAEIDSCPAGYEIGFNARYVDDVLKNMKSAGDAAVIFKFNTSGSPALITGDREGWLAVLMPMRV